MLNILSLCFGIFGIIGTIFSIYSFIKNYKVKKLKAIINSTILISDRISEYENLKISYNNENTDSFISSHIIIKNVGTDIIEPSDLTQSSPILISPIGSLLFKDAISSTITASNNSNNVFLSNVNSNKSLKVNFEFLNPKEEIHIFLLHRDKITVSGDLKGKPIKVITKRSYDNSETKDALKKKKNDLRTTKFTISFIIFMTTITLWNSNIINAEVSLALMYIAFLIMSLLL